MTGMLGMLRHDLHQGLPEMFFEQNQEDVVEDGSTIDSQRPTNNTNIDWSVDDILFQM
ncbi:19983_t:CDS:2 [Racocetra fulgida]|uniref:19983_t:CDS:1 n=1 Tax=Racocetra fulgida TaxID=60492 RepID=A0A9N8ZTP8_9GLOM|nr:19983_t:CDS:2 [Racocetra fulgida]